MPGDEGVREGTRANILERLLSPSDETIYCLMGLLIAYTVVRGIVAATLKPFFYDELITLAVASQHSARAIWDALSRAVDSHPPLFYLIEGVSLKAYSDPQIALRLPSILAFPCTIVCVFVYLRRRHDSLLAFLCSAFLLMTDLFYTQGTDARAYSMVLACLAFALVCYQRVPSLFWTAMLAAALALGEALHYYTIFSMLPFGLAELVYLQRSRQIRWKVWAALAVGVAPLIVTWPLLSNLRSYYGPHVWVHFGLSSIPVIYGQFLMTGAGLGFGFAALCFAAVVGARFLAANPLSGESNREADPVEGTLMLGLLALPMTTYAITKIMHGILLDRYVLAAILGIAVALACVVSLARGRSVALLGCFVLSCVGIHELSFWLSIHSLHFDNPAESAEAFVQKAGYPELPIVVSSGHSFLQISYYGAPQWKNRFVFLMDEQKAVQYTGTDSIDINLVVLQRYMPFSITEFSEFRRVHPTFLLYVADPGRGTDWLPSYLLSASSLQLLALEPERKLYLVRMKESP